MSEGKIEASRRMPCAMHLSGAARCARAATDVFRFLTERVPECYPSLARGHERFAVEGGGPVRLGAHIDCRERAGDQEVRHRYRVLGFERDVHLHYASRPTETVIHLPRGKIAGQADTHVYYDLDAQGTSTHIALTIVIQMPRRMQLWMALATGSRRLWQRHLNEELGNLVRAIEAEAA